MATLIKWTFGLFWLVTAGLTAFLAYSAVQMENDSQLILAWFVMCGFIFLSATWLTYNVIFGHYHKPIPKHHDLHQR